MIKSAKNIGFIFVLISITVLTGRFFLNSKNNFINTERTNIERRTIYEKLKPLLDKAKLASDQGDYLKVINILKQINQKINILNDELQAALALWDVWKNDILKCLKTATHGKRLTSLGDYEDDFKCCSELDCLDVVPAQVERGVIRAS